MSVTDFLAYLDVERRVSAHTLDAYRRDLAALTEWALAQGITPPLTNWLIDAYGWRETYRLIAMALVCVVPLLLLPMPHPPALRLRCPLSSSSR